MTQGLIIIDVQNDYFAKGQLPLVNPEAALACINQLEDYFLAQQLPIIYIQHIDYRQDAPLFKAQTSGVQLHAHLRVNSDSTIVTKQYPNSFYHTDLTQRLHQLAVDQVVICGMMTHMCVDSTTRAARELGWNPLLITDATATTDLTMNGQTVTADQVSTAFLAALASFATEQTTAEFLQQH